MSLTNPLLARFVGEPALVSAESQAWFQSCIERAHAELDASDRPLQAAVGEDFWPPEGMVDRWRPYVVKDGVLQIPVKGTLLHDFPYTIGGWATGYDYIWQAFKRGLADDAVKGIALLIDSPGGMVAGCFALVDRIAALRGTKPVNAFAHEGAYSAAYAVASAADTITVSQTGGVGSIGVLRMHADVSAALEADGVKITFIHAGKHKVDGTPYEPLPKAVRARIQQRIDASYDVFVASVARNRAMDEQAVRDTEAQTFMAHEATSNGLADAIGTLEDSLAAFVASLNSDGDEAMADEPKAEVTAEQLVAAETAARAAGVTEGAAAERARIVAILESDAGKARPKAALSAALKTSMDAEQAVAFLAELAEEKAPVAAAPAVDVLAAAMAATPNPNVGDLAAADADAEMSVADRILFNAGKGKKARA